eukprot:GHVN01101306.1.p1 GENE.GHVN01101306.1~~GHVN01101306.1.p1  ORF type:complete len:239 (+),score=48.23 GHVN01101306.1:83-718(+)
MLRRFSIRNSFTSSECENRVQLSAIYDVITHVNSSQRSSEGSEGKENRCVIPSSQVGGTKEVSETDISGDAFNEGRTCSTTNGSNLIPKESNDSEEGRLRIAGERVGKVVDEGNDILAVAILESEAIAVCVQSLRNTVGLCSLTHGAGWRVEWTHPCLIRAINELCCGMSDRQMDDRQTGGGASGGGSGGCSQVRSNRNMERVMSHLDAAE